MGGDQKKRSHCPALMPLSISAAEDRPFNERLRDFRDSRGFSRADLAAELGVTPITLYRWETGSSRPSPLAAEKLRGLGFGNISTFETNVGSVSRLKSQETGKQPREAAAELRAKGKTEIGPINNSIRLLPAPFFRNGPPDQASFHRKLLDFKPSKGQAPKTSFDGRGNRWGWIYMSASPRKASALGSFLELELRDPRMA